MRFTLFVSANKTLYKSFNKQDFGQKPKAKAKYGQEEKKKG